MVYSEHRFLPNMCWARTHGMLSTSDVCSQQKNESLGDEKHICNVFDNPSHPCLLSFVTIFLADTGYSSVPCSIEENQHVNLPHSPPKVRIRKCFIYGIPILFLTGCKLATFSSKGKYKKSVNLWNSDFLSYRMQTRNL